MSHKRITEKMKQEMVQLYRSGLSQAEISKQFDCTRQYVSIVMRELGEPARKPHRTKEEREFDREIHRVAKMVVRAAKLEQLHGTRYMYTHYKCRCADCREAMRLYMLSLREKEQPPTHGLSGYTNYGCRCDICTKANTEKGRLYPESHKRWYKNNRQKVYETQARWRKENPDKVKEYSRRQYEKKKKASENLATS